MSAPRDLSTRLAKWFGLYAGPDAIYLTLIPCLPFRWARGARRVVR
jgi:hypothetical protein